MKLPRHIGSGPAVVVAGVLALLGALGWARGRDPYVREWFAVPVPGGSAVRCLAVLPKPAKPRPVVVYLHRSGGSLVEDGRDLRRLAERGLAAVSVEYDQTNEVHCAAQLAAVLRTLSTRRWADTNAVVGMGYSLGANRWLDLAHGQTKFRPAALVLLAGGRTPASDLSSASLSGLPVLLVQGAEDEVFSTAQQAQAKSWLEAHGASVESRLIPGADHSLRLARGGVLRTVGEWCRERFGRPKARTEERSVNEWRAGAASLFWWLLPALTWLAGARAWNRWHGLAGGSPAQPGQSSVPVPPGMAWSLRWLAGLLALLALGLAALHLVLPRLEATERRLALAGSWLVPPAVGPDFDWLAGRPGCANWKLGLLQAHAELAHYNRGLVNWTVDDPLHRDFVLSPQLGPEVTVEPGDWRRPMWESLYPRIRRESAPAGAAAEVLRHLRERVSVMPDASAGSVLADWLRQATDAAGWERLAAAALRSVGIPARLREGRAEFWDGHDWRTASEGETPWL